jgi:hypothetical protein
MPEGRPHQSPRPLPRAVCGHDSNVQLAVGGSGVLEGGDATADRSHVGHAHAAHLVGFIGDTKDKLDDEVNSVENKLN